MIYRLKLVAVLSLLFTLAGCGMGGVNLAGNWTGTLSGGGSSAPITMALTQDGSAVSGTLAIEGASGAVSGTLNGSNLTLTVGTASFTGTATGASINATSTVQTDSGPLPITLAATKQ